MSPTLTRLAGSTRPFPVPPDHPASPITTPIRIAVASGLPFLAEPVVFMLTPPALLQVGLSAEGQRSAGRPRVTAIVSIQPAVANSQRSWSSEKSNSNHRVSTTSISRS